MKEVSKLIILFSFFLVAIFGFSAMMNGSAHCLVSLMEGGVCPEGLLGFASFHIGFFKHLSSVASGNLALLAAFVILVMSFSAVIFAKPARSFVSKFFSEVFAGKSAVLKKEIRIWLSLLETSPTSVSSR